MSQPDLDLSVGAPPPSHLIAISAAIQPSPSDPTLLLTSTRVWGNLSACQQAGVRQALIALCCQIAAEVLEAGRSAPSSQEAGDEQG